MNFNAHSNFEGKHAFLGASKYHWINYDTEKLLSSYSGYRAAERGTELHAFAATCIKLGQRLPRTRKTLNMYVNDAIGFGMSPEVVLFYSEHCFGTADAISYRNGKLRIHDYKSGVIPAHMEQLLIYAALFCLEYHRKPEELAEIECRIYQNDEVMIHNPGPDEIRPIMNKIVEFDKILTKKKMEESA